MVKRDGPSQNLTAVLLSLMILAIALQRLALYDQLVDWDPATYSLIGNEINHGRRLYADVWDMKPPAIFVTYALAQRVTGFNRGEFYWLSVVAVATTMLGIYAAASVRGRSAGLWAALLWSAACYETYCGAGMPNTEIFINAFMIWALAIVLRLDRINWTQSASLLAGVLLGISTLYKQVAIAPAIMLAGAHVVASARGARLRSLGQSGIMIGAIGALWLATIGYFQLTQRGWIFLATNFTYAHYYSGNPAINLLHSLTIANLLPWRLSGLAPLAATAMLVLLPGQNKWPPRQRLVILFMMLGVHVAVAMPGQFKPYYYQLWLPSLSICGGWGLRKLGDLLPQNKSRRMEYWLGGAVALGIFWPQVAWFGLNTDQWAAKKYTGLFPEAYQDIKNVDRLIPANQNIFIWGDEPWAYIECQRRPAAAALFKSHTLQGPLAPWLSELTAAQLRRDPPPLILDWNGWPAPAENPIQQFIAENYHRDQTIQTHSLFVFYIRNGGEPNGAKAIHDH